MFEGERIYFFLNLQVDNACYYDVDVIILQGSAYPTTRKYLSRAARYEQLGFLYAYISLCVFAFHLFCSSFFNFLLGIFFCFACEIVKEHWNYC